MHEDARPRSDKMLSFAPSAIFTGAWDHRPAVPSPLSSSPVRASSPLSPIDSNALSQRQTQSSPIQPPKFKYAARPTRPNPVMQRREEAQDKRRRGFLQSVRQKSDDKAWRRRDIEGQFLKASYLDSLGQLSYGAPDLSEADIEDAMTFQQEQMHPQDQHGDDMMMDEPPDEDDDVEAIVASYQEQASPAPRPSSPVMSDPDYDDIFAELIAQEKGAGTQNPTPSGLIDTTGEDDPMSFN